MAQRYVIGIDGGTESLRAGVFDASGRALAFAASPYPTQYPHPSWAEQSPDDWWAALGAAVREAVARAGVAPADVAAVCADTTCCTVVALGDDGAPLRPALLWADMRSSRQAARVAACGAPELRVNGGGRGPVSAEWMVPKALWLKDNEPDVYARARWVCEYQDYLNFRMTGAMVASANNIAVRWHAADGWPRELLARVGAPELLGKWPQEVAQLGERIGNGLTESAAEHLGLPPGTAVAQGGADAFVGVLGLGVLRPGQMAMLTGSSHLHIGVSARPLCGPGMFGSYGGGALPGGAHIVEGGQTSTGSVVNWARARLFGGDGGGGAAPSYADLDAEAAAVPRGCEGLTALDHFQGNRTPHTDALSRGALAGLTLKHGRGHVFRALLEAVCFGTEAVLRAMRAAGFAPTELVVAGGAARSPLWLQMHADVCGLPLRLTECGDAPALGCAMLACVAAGIHADVGSAAAAMVRVARTVAPDPAAHAEYAELFEKRYAPLYPALQPLFHQQAAAKAAVSADASEAAAEAGADAGAEKASNNNSNGAFLSPPAPPPRPLVFPSLLAADFAALGDEAARALDAGADGLHLDCFDGSAITGAEFTFGPPMVAALRRRFPRAYLDCHFAVDDAAKYLPALAKAGASSVTFQAEQFAGDAAAIARLAAGIRALGMRAGVALDLATPADAGLLKLASEGAIDSVLVMTVRCGFGGQRFNADALAKVAALRAAAPGLMICVDGGVNADTARMVGAAGANAVVAGTAVFAAPDGAEAAIAAIRGALLDALPAGLLQQLKPVAATMATAV